MKLLQQLQLSDLVGDLNHLTSSAGVGVPASASLIMFGRYSPSSDQGILRMSPAATPDTYFYYSAVSF